MKVSGKNNPNYLIGQKVEIRLSVFDPESYQRRPDPLPIPQLPTVRGKCIRRVLGPYGTWRYVVQLGELLFLDREGVGEDARQLYSTCLLLVSPDSLTSNFYKDSIYEKLSQGKPSASIVSAVKDLDKLPNEFSKDDPAWKFFPVIGGGVIRLLPSQ